MMCPQAVQQERSRSSPVGTRSSIRCPHCSQNAGPGAEDSTIEWRRTTARLVGLVQVVDARRASAELPSQNIASVERRKTSTERGGEPQDTPEQEGRDSHTPPAPLSPAANPSHTCNHTTSHVNTMRNSSRTCETLNCTSVHVSRRTSISASRLASVPVVRLRKGRTACSSVRGGAADTCPSAPLSNPQSSRHQRSCSGRWCRLGKPRWFSIVPHAVPGRRQYPRRRFAAAAAAAAADVLESVPSSPWVALGQPRTLALLRLTSLTVSLIATSWLHLLYPPTIPQLPPASRDALANDETHVSAS